MNNLNIQLNNSDCIKSVENIGSTTYINICNGHRAVVGWGTWNYIGAILILLVIVLLILMFIIVKPIDGTENDEETSI